MNLLIYSYCFATFVAGIVLSIGDKSGAPYHWHAHVTDPQESPLKYGTNNQRDFKLPILEDEANKKEEEKDASVWYKWNNVLRWEPKSTTEGTLLTMNAEKNDARDIYDQSEGLELGTQSFKLNREPVQPSKEYKEGISPKYFGNHETFQQADALQQRKHKITLIPCKRIDPEDGKKINHVTFMQQTLLAYHAPDDVHGEEDLFIDGADSWRSATTRRVGHNEDKDDALGKTASDKIAPKKHAKDLEGLRHRRSDSNADKSTQAEITQLFQGFEKSGLELNADLKSTERLSSSSPEQSSSARNTTLDEEGQSGVHITHSVERGGVPIEAQTLLKFVNTTQTPTTQTPLTIRFPTNISMANVLKEQNLEMGPDKLSTHKTDSDTKLHKTVPRKGADAGNVVGRKGVDDINITGKVTSLNDSLLPNSQSVLGVTTSHLNSSSTKTSVLPSPSADRKSIIIESNPPLKKKPNPKPLTLTDKTSFSTTPMPQEHVSPKRDYVVPVVILILTVPLVTILGIFLYKKGSEYWSRRHYRRMDFLIDGMYHD